MDITRKTLPPQHYIYVDRECPYGPEIAQAMESGFGEVFTFVGTQGLTPLAMPMSVYTEMDPNTLRFRAGVIVSAEDAAKAAGDIKSDQLPTGDVMTATHIGSYDSMSDSHQALWKHMETEGIAAAMPVWEIYIDDPGQTPPDQLKTQIFRTIG